MDQTIRTKRLFVEALKQSDLSILQRLKLRLVYNLPAVSSAVNEFIVETATAEGDMSTMADGRIIEIILDKLPEIIKLIELLISLF